MFACAWTHGICSPIAAHSDRMVSVVPIRLFGDPVLRTPAAEVVTFDKELRGPGQGPHRHDARRPRGGSWRRHSWESPAGVTYWVDDELGHLVNPVLDLSDEQQDGEEGCLSVPDLTFECKRARSVVAKGMNMHGEPG